MQKLELRVSDEFLGALGKSKRDAEKTALQHVVLNMVHANAISASYGADVLEISYRAMLKLMADNNVPLISYEDGELEEELKVLGKLPA